MKTYSSFIVCCMLLLAGFLLSACEDDYASNSADPAIPLTVEGKDIKVPGRGQYRLSAQSGEAVSVKAVIPSDVKSFTITKTVNLDVDETYGNGGVLALDPASLGPEFVFGYTPDQTDVDQLIGFTFRADNIDGSVVSSDLTLVVTLSPRDNLPRRKWLLKSKIWVDKNNAQDIKECEQDNYYFFNEDHTMAVDYGANTGSGSGGCEFDGLNVYDSWELSDDEKLFTIRYYGIFTPENIVSEVYRVKTLTTEKLELEIDFDLTWLGEGPEETFIYEYVAQPK